MVRPVHPILLALNSLFSTKPCPTKASTNTSLSELLLGDVLLGDVEWLQASCQVGGLLSTFANDKKKDDACRQGGHRSHGLSLIRRTLYPTELLGDVEVWRHV